MNELENIKALDDQINECIQNLKNAKTGTDVKLNIIAYEQLMLCREQAFMNYVLQERYQANQNNSKKSNYPVLWTCAQGIAIILLAIAIILIKQ